MTVRYAVFATDDLTDAAGAAIGVLNMQLRVRVNQRRLEHMRRHAIAQLKRAPRAHRQALSDRLARRMAEKCVRVECEPI